MSIPDEVIEARKRVGLWFGFHWRGPLEDRFWRRVRKSADGCWEWRGSGIQIAHDGAHVSARVVSWRIHNGDLPSGHFVHQVCGNPRCVRPDHLIVTTAQRLVRPKHPVATKQRKTIAPADRFWTHVEKTDSCWLWIGSIVAGGYGRITTNRRGVQAHRMSWELHFGTIPDGLLVLHKCDNPPCVNPDHLFLGTQSDNIRDAVSKGRHFTPFATRYPLP